jgi:hypothetical protein
MAGSPPFRGGGAIKLIPPRCRRGLKRVDDEEWRDIENRTIIFIPAERGHIIFVSSSSSSLLVAFVLFLDVDRDNDVDEVAVASANDLAI